MTSLSPQGGSHVSPQKTSHPHQPARIDLCGTAHLYLDQHQLDGEDRDRKIRFTGHEDLNWVVSVSIKLAQGKGTIDGLTVQIPKGSQQPIS